MALSGQFSLIALELKHLVPPSVTRAAQERAIRFMRDCRKSGSDIIVEEDLAVVFGRCRIDPLFASTFRCAVGEHTSTPLSSLLDLVVEAGVGPTVRRSLLPDQDPKYFATVVQLSLLAYTHELPELAAGLAKALAKAGGEPLDQWSIHKTIRACQEQTATFPWDYSLKAIEVDLASTDTELHLVHSARVLPYILLETLIDALPALQLLDRSHLIRIKTYTGISTIILWVHVVLGLDVLVIYDGGTLRYGRGEEQVIIECYSLEDAALPPSLHLFAKEHSNGHRDYELFQIQASDDPVLIPAQRHAVQGFGTKILSQLINEPAVIKEVSHRILASCLLLGRENAEAYMRSKLNYGWHSAPTDQQIYEAAAIFFEHLDYPRSHVERMLHEPSIALCAWSEENLPPSLVEWLHLPPSARRPGALKELWSLPTQHAPLPLPPSTHSVPDEPTPAPSPRRSSTPPPPPPPPPIAPTPASSSYFQKRFRALAQLILTLANLPHIPPSTLFDLSSLPSPSPADLTSTAHTFSHPVTFARLARLLLGPHYALHEDRLSHTAAFTAWGHTLALPSLSLPSPACLPRAPTLHQGTLTRNGERKHWVLDGISRHTGGTVSLGVPHPTAAVATGGAYRVVGRPGQRVRLTNSAGSSPLHDVDAEDEGQDEGAHWSGPFFNAEEDVWHVVLPVTVGGYLPGVAGVRAYPGMHALRVRDMQELAWRAPGVMPWACGCGGAKDPDADDVNEDEDGFVVPEGALAFRGWNGPIISSGGSDDHHPDGHALTGALVDADTVHVCVMRRPEALWLACFHGRWEYWVGGIGVKWVRVFLRRHDEGAAPCCVRCAAACVRDCGGAEKGSSADKGRKVEAKLLIL